MSCFLTFWVYLSLYWGCVFIIVQNLLFSNYSTSSKVRQPIRREFDSSRFINHWGGLWSVTILSFLPNKWGWKYFVIAQTIAKSSFSIVEKYEMHKQLVDLIHHHLCGLLPTNPSWGFNSRKNPWHHKRLFRSSVGRLFHIRPILLVLLHQIKNTY